MNARKLFAGVALRVALPLVVLALGGCPERKEMSEQVGGAPKAQVDQARARIEKAEKKLEENAAAAAAVAD